MPATLRTYSTWSATWPSVASGMGFASRSSFWAFSLAAGSVMPAVRSVTMASRSL